MDIAQNWWSPSIHIPRKRTSLSLSILPLPTVSLQTRVTGITVPQDSTWKNTEILLQPSNNFFPLLAKNRTFSNGSILDCACVKWSLKEFRRLGADRRQFYTATPKWDVNTEGGLRTYSPDSYQSQKVKGKCQRMIVASRLSTSNPTQAQLDFLNLLKTTI